MSDTAVANNKIWTTPMRDLLRGRVTGRLDWKSQIAAADLSVPVVELIERVVKRTRLWRLEQAAVANELLAHFQDGMSAGTDPAVLVERFGDQRTAAKLIRRAKRRGRPMLWHVWNNCLRVTTALMLIYSVFLIRFCIGQPTIAVDYISRLNTPILSKPETDRAWPLWRKAILESSDAVRDGALHYSDAIAANQNEVPWAETVRWLDEHSGTLEIARQAAAKPALGFVLGPEGSIRDVQMCFPQSPQSSDPRQPVISLLLPHLRPLLHMSRALSFDAKHAAELHDGARVMADLLAMLGLAGQLRGADGIVITQATGLTVDANLADRLQRVLSEHPGILNDTQLIQLAHTLAGPRVAADLLNVSNERCFFDDIIQRIYTDNGSGEGHLTLKGAELSQQWMNSSDLNLWAAVSTVPLVSASRAELVAKFDALLDQSIANLHQPLRDVINGGTDSQVIAMHRSSTDNLRFAPVILWFFSSDNIQANCESYLGTRDGTLVGISLELYHRKHGIYPAELKELTPGLLPELPTDRITGDPIKYRLVDDKPVVYSVGGDRKDDGGKRSAANPNKRNAAQMWNQSQMPSPGDWVLYPPDPADSGND